MLRPVDQARLRRAPLAATLLAAFFLALITGLAMAPVARAALEGVPFAISGSGEQADQQNPHIVALPDHDLWLVIWEDWRNWQTTGADLYGGFVNLNGTACGSPFVISNAAGNQTVPQAAYRDTPDDSDDTVLVVWQDTRGDGDGGFIYYRGLNVSALAADCSGLVLEPAQEQEVSFVQTATYIDPSYLTAPTGDTLRSRKLPKVAFDPVRDRFWLNWTESRTSLQQVSEICFNPNNPHFAMWVFGDPALPGYVSLDGATLAELPGHLGYIPLISADLGPANGIATVFSGTLVNRPVTPLYVSALTLIPYAAEILDTADGATVYFDQPVLHPPIQPGTVVLQTQLPFTEAAGTGDGVERRFTTFLANAPVLPGTVRIQAGADVVTDNGSGVLAGNGTGVVNYTTGAVDVTFTVAPALATAVQASYTGTITATDNGAGSLSAGLGSVNYDTGRILVAFDVIPANGTPLVIDYQQLVFLQDDGAGAMTGAGGVGTVNYTTGAVSLTFDAPPLAGTAIAIDYWYGVYADVIRNLGTSTNRRLSSTVTPLRETYVYEYFTNLTNMTVASDTTSPETLMAWEGIRQTATLTCTCTDVNKNEACDFGEPTADSLLTAATDDGLVHVYSLFDKIIPVGSVPTQRLDNSSAPNYYPSVAFDPVHRKFLTTFEDTRAGSATKVYGQLLHSGGGLYNANFIISYSDTDDDGAQDPTVADSRQTRPSVSYDLTNQRFFVTWQDGRNSRVSRENLDIYGQFVDSEGSLRGDNYPISIAEANQYNPATAFNLANHQFLTVWKDARDTENAFSDIFGQRFSLGQPQLVLLNTDDTALIPPLLNYGQLVAGQTSFQPVKVRNTGDATVFIDCLTGADDLPFTSDPAFGINSLPGQLAQCECRTGGQPDYAACDTGPGSTETLALVPSGEYTLSVAFSPQAEGTFISQFAIQSDASSPAVFLQGLALADDPPPQANIKVTPSALDFDASGETIVGQTRSMNLTFTNDGNVDVRVTAVDLLPTTPFAISGLAAGTVIPKGSAIITVVTFSPQAATTSTANLSVLFDSGVQPAEVTFRGTGSANAAIGLSALNLTFGNVLVGQTRSQNVLLTNSGDVDVRITAMDFPSGTPFAITGFGSGTVIAKGTSINAVATFSPTQPQASSVDVFLLFDNGLPDITLSLAGTGVATPSLQFNPSTLAFADTNVGEIRSLNFTISNTGDRNVQILAVDMPATAPFAVAGVAAGTVLAKGSSLATVARFSPSTAASHVAVMRLVFDSGLAPVEIAFSGRGLDTSVQMAPSAMAFGSVATGSTSTQTLSIVNTTSSAVTVSQLSVPPPFALTGIDNGSSVPANGTLSGTVTFAPTAPQVYTGTLSVTLGSETTARTVALSGTGTNADQIYTVESHTAEQAYPLIIDTVTAKTGALYILLGHVPLSNGTTYAVTGTGQLRPFASRSGLAANWNTLFYAASPAGIDSVDLGTVSLQALGGTLYLGSFVEDSVVAFDAADSLVRFMNLTVHTFTGEWELTYDWSGDEYVHPDHLLVLDRNGRLQGAMGAYNTTSATKPLFLSHGTGDGYLIAYNDGRFTYIFTIATLDADSFEGTWTYTDGISTWPAENVRGTRIQ
ncbi:MAG: choice-of-anchor D domain-containing protein [Thermodesulfobacteriota bacterium]